VVGEPERHHPLISKPRPKDQVRKPKYFTTLILIS